MKLDDFKILGNFVYGNFPLVEYMWNEIVVEDTYGLRKLKESNTQIKTIVDIGGNLGVFSLYARELFPKARIISLEALTDTFISLQANTKNSNIEVYNIALGDGSRLYLNQCKDHSGANQFKKNKTNTNVTVESKTLKTIFKELKIKKPYIIKMDIEGSELFMYKDETCKSILQESKYFTMEYHDVDVLGYHINKSIWDKWLQDIFIDFEIDGLGGNASGATYRILKHEQ